jgi:hypothetical protein
MLLADALLALADLTASGPFTLDGVRPPAPGAAAGPAAPPPGASTADLGTARRVLATLTRYLSARDVLPPEEASLLAAVARALAAAGGAAALAAPGAASPAGGGGGGALAPQPPLAASAPGLLHTLLGVHVRMLLSAAATSRSPLALHRAVNALHLLRALLQQRGMAAPPSLRLFLPCLLRPLVQLLGAGADGGGDTACGGLLAAQLQVYKLAQQLLKQPGGMALPALGLLAQDGGGGGGVALFG